MPRAFTLWILAASLLVLGASPARAQERCFDEPGPAHQAGTALELYARAREAFQAKRFVEAAALFDLVATEHSESDVGVFAAQLSLESMNVLQRPACFDRIASSVPRYQGLYCAGSLAEKNEEICGVLARISSDLRRLQAEQLVTQADKTRGERARKLYLEAGQEYAQVWTDSYESACKKGHKERCARGDEVLYNAARSFQAARDLGRATAMRMKLIDPQLNLHETQLARQTVYELGGSFQAIGEYDQAAGWYERFASSSPKDQKAPQALGDAIILRIALGQLDQANKNADLFHKTYSNRQEQAATIALAMGEEWSRRGDASSAKKALNRDAGKILKSLPGARAQLDFLIGKSYAQLGETEAARKSLERAAAVKINPPPSTFGTGVDEATALRALGRELTAIGQAQLMLADLARNSAAKLAIKKGDAASLQAKQDAVREAEKRYAKILEIQPAPPPGPVVIAGARVARLRSQLWAQAHLAEASEAEALLGEARVAHKRCVDMAVKYESIDPESARCARWLARHFPAEFHVMSEIAPRASWSSSGLPKVPAPLDEDGEPALPIEPTAR